MSMEDNHPTPERRANATQLETRVYQLEQSMRSMLEKVEAMHDIITTARGFFRVLAWIGDAIKPIIFIGGLVAAAVAAVSKYKSGG